MAATAAVAGDIQAVAWGRQFEEGRTVRQACEEGSGRLQQAGEASQVAGVAAGSEEGRAERQWQAGRAQASG